MDDFDFIEERVTTFYGEEILLLFFSSFSGLYLETRTRPV